MAQSAIQDRNNIDVFDVSHAEPQGLRKDCNHLFPDRTRHFLN